MISYHKQETETVVRSMDSVQDFGPGFGKNQIIFGDILPWNYTGNKNLYKCI